MEDYLDDSGAPFAGAAPPDPALLELLARYQPGLVDLQALATARSALPDLMIGGVDPTQWGAREQGSRNTCIAFAAAASAEVLRQSAEGALGPDLSPQFLYYEMRTTAELPANSGVMDYEKGACLISQARDILAAKGICREDLAPYSKFSSDIKGPAPDAAAFADARTRIFSGQDYWHRTKHGAQPGLPAIFLGLLQQGRPIVAAFPLHRWIDGGISFFDARTKLTGVVRTPWDPGFNDKFKEGVVGGHAVCLIGMVSQQTAGDDAWFVFRNSKGRRDFASHPDTAHGVPASGYGVISATAVQATCWEYLCPATAQDGP